MKIVDSRFGRFVVRRWSSEEDRGINIALTVPRADLAAERMTSWAYQQARRHPWVKSLELQILALSNRVEALKEELEDGQRAFDFGTAAVMDAQDMYERVMDVVEIIGMYQRSLKTLHAPDPHESRVQLVVNNFYKQYEGLYGRHDG